jgi:hypothetical protein
MRFNAFSDESYVSGSRYRSIGVFSFPSSRATRIELELSEILASSDVKEFKWEKLRNAKYKFCAVKLIDFIIENINQLKIRLDVLIWDTYDKRHKIIGRDDRANYERMFFHLLRNTLKKRGQNTRWNIYPDERMGVDWATIKQCLQYKGSESKYVESLFGGFFSDPYYTIDILEEVNSDENPCCQIADLFAGIAVFAKIDYELFGKWKAICTKELSLFSDDKKFSNTQQFRFEVIHHLDNKCKENRLGVSLKSIKCFWTPHPENPINFWHYLPQHESDKAPTRLVR